MTHAAHTPADPVDRPSVVVVTANRAEQTLRCVDSLLTSDVPLELIVVDNGSVDGTPARLRKTFGEHIVLIESPTNRGAAGGRNLGADVARGTLLVFVDSDNIVAPDLVGRLCRLLEADDTVALAGPLMGYRDAPDTVWCAGGQINLWSGRTRYRHAGRPMREVAAANDVPYEVGHIPNIFACRRVQFRQIGGFHEPFFILFEESDLAERLRRLAPRVVVDPQARAWHDVPPITGGSLRAYGIQSAERCELMACNRLLFLRRNAGRMRLTVFLTLFLLPLTGYYLRLLLSHGRRDFARAYLKGVRRGLREISGLRTT